MPPFVSTAAVRARPAARSAAPLLAAALLAACGGDVRAAPDNVERFDSAGLTITVNRGPDRPLDWSFEPVARLGGHDEGPQAFHRVPPAGIGFDRSGAMYVLDSGNHRVTVFDTDGRHIRTLGRAGSGPGELGRFTLALSVAEDGALAVYDMQRRGLTRWDADGQVQESLVFPDMFESRSILVANGRTYATVVRRDEATRESTLDLVALGPTDTLRLASLQQPPPGPIQFRNCPVQLMGMPAIFAPGLEWAGSSGRIVVNIGPSYALQVLEDGEPVAIVRRDLEPMPATRELAARELGDSMRITFGSGSCSIPPEDVADARGVAQHVPLVNRVAVAPDGSIWVRRNVFDTHGKTRIDVFSADGTYVGTLPADAPWPAAFRSADEFAAIENDEFDLQHIVIRRVRRD